jgi:hypothetical protein
VISERVRKIFNGFSFGSFAPKKVIRSRKLVPFANEELAAAVMAYGERLNQPDIPPQADELRGYFQARLAYYFQVSLRLPGMILFIRKSQKAKLNTGIFCLMSLSGRWREKYGCSFTVNDALRRSESGLGRNDGES